MYKELLEALTTKFQGVSETVLSRIAHKHEDAAKTLEDVKTITEGVTIQQIIDGEADRRATEASTTAVKNYKKKLETRENAENSPTVRGESPSVRAQGEKPSVTVEEPQIEALKAQVAEFAAAMAKLQTERVTESRKERLKHILQRLPEKLRKGYERADVAQYSEEDFATYLDSIDEEVKDIAADISRRGAIFSRPLNGQKGRGEEELSKEQLEAIAHREGTPKDGEQPF